MLRTTLIAAMALAAALIALQPTSAAADTNFDFYFGIDPYQQWPRTHDRRYYDERITCRQARRILRRHHGYHDITTVDCLGDSFKFRAWKRGHKYRIKINAWTGQVTSVRRLR
jgi:hypothetical protein